MMPIPKSTIGAIEIRRSCRTYQERPVEPEKLEALFNPIAKGIRGPFGNPVRFRLVNPKRLESDPSVVLGTYGVIKGASLFLIGAVGKAPLAMEDYGFCLEKIILEATAMGLGTCWLGGTFKRRGFAQVMALSGNELMPAITPLGYAGVRPSLTDRFFRFGAGSDQRRPWGDLFFDGDADTPLTRESAGPYGIPLACVRLAPSASNKQPWRVIREGNRFHFFLRPTPGYEKLGPEIRLQNIDMGIALCHFTLAAAELKLKGRLNRIDSRPAVGEMEYTATWTDEA